MPAALPRRLEQLHQLLLSKKILKEIALDMGLTAGSVKEYATEMYSRLGLHRRIELMSEEIDRLRYADGPTWPPIP